MQEIISKKHRLGDHGTVTLTEECRAILQLKFPQKLKDLGSFTLPFSIGTDYEGKALCDLSASINLMLYSVFIDLGLVQVKCKRLIFNLRIDQLHMLMD